MALTFKMTYVHAEFTNYGKRTTSLPSVQNLEIWCNVPNLVPIWNYNPDQAWMLIGFKEAKDAKLAKFYWNANTTFQVIPLTKLRQWMDGWITMQHNHWWSYKLDSVNRLWHRVKWSKADVVCGAIVVLITSVDGDRQQRQKRTLKQPQIIHTLNRQPTE